MSDKFKLREFFLSEGVEFEDGLLKNVVVIGPKSANNRDISDDAQRSAVPQLDGMRVYADHLHGNVKGPRSIGDRLGHLENPRFVEAEHRTRADFRYLTSHPKAVTIREAYEQKRPYFGLSIVYDGTGHRDTATGRVHVHKIDKIHSCDVVDSAATGTLAEQEEAEAPADPAAMHQQGLEQMILAIVKGGGTPEEIGKKITDLLKTIAPAAEAAPADGSAPPPMSEQTLTKVVGTLIERKLAERDEKFTALVEQEVQRRAQAAQYVKPTTPAPPPAKAPEGKDAPPKDPAERKKWLHTP